MYGFTGVGYVDDEYWGVDFGADFDHDADAGVDVVDDVIEQELQDEDKKGTAAGLRKDGTEHDANGRACEEMSESVNGVEGEIVNRRVDDAESEGADNGMKGGEVPMLVQTQEQGY